MEEIRFTRLAQLTFMRRTAEFDRLLEQLNIPVQGLFRHTAAMMRNEQLENIVDQPLLVTRIKLARRLFMQYFSCLRFGHD